LKKLFVAVYNTSSQEAPPLEGEAIDMDKLARVSCTCTTQNTVPNNFS
jgi:hypothetical protein